MGRLQNTGVQGDQANVVPWRPEVCGGTGASEWLQHNWLPCADRRKLLGSPPHSSVSLAVVGPRRIEWRPPTTQGRLQATGPIPSARLARYRPTRGKRRVLRILTKQGRSTAVRPQGCGWLASDLDHVD